MVSVFFWDLVEHFKLLLELLIKFLLLLRQKLQVYVLGRVLEQLINLIYVVLQNLNVVDNVSADHDLV